MDRSYPIEKAETTGEAATRHESSSSKKRPHNGGSEESKEGAGMPKKKSSKRAKTAAKCKAKDPSLEFISSPLSCPMVISAKSFFDHDLQVAFPFEVHIGPIHGWRTLSKLAVRGTKQSGGKIAPNQCIGLFEPRSHEVVPCFDSPVHHSSINNVAKLVEAAFVLKGVTGYREDTDCGLVRYLLFSVETSSGKVQLTIVLNKLVPVAETQKGEGGKRKVKDEEEEEVMRSVVEWLTSKKRKEQFHSIWLHYHPATRHDNSITGRLENSWRCVFGDDMLRECMSTILILNEADNPELQPVCSKLMPQLCFPPNVFRQANLQGFAKIIASIRSFIPRKCRCIELYGGVGTIGLNLLDLVKKLQCSDENPYNVHCFDRAVNDLVATSGKAKYRKRATYLNSSAKERALSGDFELFDLLLVDPPRKGLDVEVIDALLATHSLTRLVYVSCGFKAFVNDCQRIIGSGSGWSLVFAEGHVLFPGADHIETLAVFDRTV